MVNLAQGLARLGKTTILNLNASQVNQHPIAFQIVARQFEREVRELLLLLLDRDRLVEQVHVPALQAEHRRWWSDFWDRSFVHLGDNYLENL